MELLDFTTSIRWLDRFKVRHGIKFKLVCGESAAINNEDDTVAGKQMFFRSFSKTTQDVIFITLTNLDFFTK